MAASQNKCPQIVEEDVRTENGSAFKELTHSTKHKLFDEDSGGFLGEGKRGNFKENSSTIKSTSEFSTLSR
ncbi:hypothetical protein NECAME_07695 [Necator americanus]|uniref:Uncharacterized protein n=1 Tax=Necator americanus TaxID=51031 RepID=W2TMN0_NECAM|nr:hypothetical protein NECAME_07695 [Necator americanus]ETN82919.1 hypothetical protein NECAME_07695 [Necator americanus]